MTGTSYLLGVATVPAAISAGWLLYHAGRLANRRLDNLMKGLPLGKAQERAGFAAFAACTRRARLFVFGGVGIAVMAGYDGKDAEKVYNAVYPTLVAPARVNRRSRRPGGNAEGMGEND